MPSETNIPVFVLRGRRVPFATAGPGLKHNERRLEGVKSAG